MLRYVHVYERVSKFPARCFRLASLCSWFFLYLISDIVHANSSAWATTKPPMKGEMKRNAAQTVYVQEIGYVKRKKMGIIENMNPRLSWSHILHH